MARIPDSYVARISGSFELDDGSEIDVDDEITLEVKVSIQEVGLRGMRDGGLRMTFVAKPTHVRVRRDGRYVDDSGESYVEIGGQRMTQAQFYAARFPLLTEAPSDVPTVSVDEFLDEVPAGQAVRIEDPRPALAEEPEEEPRDVAAGREGSAIPDGPPRGTRISAVQERSNVGGSSQAERDPVLARFLQETGQQ